MDSGYSNFDLRGLFDDLNRRHWGGRLYRPMIRFAITTGSGVGKKTIGQCTGCWSIEIDQDILTYLPWKAEPGQDSVENTMAHEMVHLFLAVSGSRRESPHGRVFQREARRVGLARKPFLPGKLLLWRWLDWILWYLHDERH